MRDRFASLLSLKSAFFSTRASAPGRAARGCLQQFFKWLVEDEQEMDRSPMERVRQPKIPRKLVPVMRDEETARLLGQCTGRDFVSLRDQALIRLYYNTGARLSEVADLQIDDVDLNTESVRFHGKGAKDPRVRVQAEEAEQPRRVGVRLLSG